MKTTDFNFIFPFVEHFPRSTNAFSLLQSVHLFSIKQNSSTTPQNRRSLFVFLFESSSWYFCVPGHVVGSLTAVHLYPVSPETTGHIHPAFCTKGCDRQTDSLNGWLVAFLSMWLLCLFWILTFGFWWVHAVWVLAIYVSRLCECLGTEPWFNKTAGCQCIKLCVHKKKAAI